MGISRQRLISYSRINMSKIIKIPEQEISVSDDKIIAVASQVEKTGIKFYCDVYRAYKYPTSPEEIEAYNRRMARQVHRMKMIKLCFLIFGVFFMASSYYLPGLENKVGFLILALGCLYMVFKDYTKIQ